MKNERSNGRNLILFLKENIFIIFGLLLISISSHMTGFFILRNLQGSTKLFVGLMVISIILFIIGIISAGVGVHRIYQELDIKKVLKKLCLLGIIYFITQLILALAMGILARVLQVKMDGETTKFAISMVIRVLQIPLRAAAIIAVVSILKDENMITKEILLKACVLYVIYTFVQFLFGFLGENISFTVIRVILSTVLTVGLWTSIYWICTKEESKYGA